MTMPDNLIIPGWPAHPHILAGCTIRCGGDSCGPYHGNNMALHVGDDPEAVQRNRSRLLQQLALNSEPSWLEQTHGIHIINLDEGRVEYRGDASFTCRANTTAVVLTADCLPLLFRSKAVNCVAAVHAGWRGLAAGIIEACYTQLNRYASDFEVWLGPAIGAQVFEVGSDVYAAFMQQDPGHATGFTAKNNQHWLMDIYHIARQKLLALGIARSDIYGGEYCTYSQPDLFYSYRRDGTTGRMASFISII